MCVLHTQSTWLSTHTKYLIFVYTHTAPEFRHKLWVTNYRCQPCCRIVIFSKQMYYDCVKQSTLNKVP